MNPTPYISRIAAELEAGSCLDVGSGNGRNALYLANEGWRVDCIEPDGPTADLVRGLHINGALFECKIQDCALGVDCYDLVICNMVLHFMDQKAQVQALEKIAAATKPGGTVYIASFSDSNQSALRPHATRISVVLRSFPDWEVHILEEAKVAGAAAAGVPFDTVAWRVVLRRPITGRSGGRQRIPVAPIWSQTKSA